MNSKGRVNYFSALIFVAFVIFTPFFQSEKSGIYAQSGNTISGHVFGLERQSIADVNVELLDEFFRSVARTLTDGSGRYFFQRVSSGRFQVRVMPFGTDYEEQTQEIEIINITRETASGGFITSGFSNEQRDFYLKIRRGATANVKGVIFAQEIPEQAKKLYDTALTNLNNKKEKEGLEGLKSALEIFPKYYYALEKLGSEYVRLGHFEAAQILLNIAVEVNPRGFKSWYGLAYSLYSLKQNEKALKAVQTAVEINALSPEALLLHGVLLRNRERFDEAEKQLVKSKDLSKGSIPEVHRQLGLLYGYNLKRYDDAIKELKSFLKLQPNNKERENITKIIKEFENNKLTAK